MNKVLLMFLYSYRYLYNEENCGQTNPEIEARYNKIRAEEFLKLRDKFYNRFPIQHDCDYSLENVIFMKFDELQAENKRLKKVIKYKGSKSTT